MQIKGHSLMVRQLHFLGRGMQTGDHSLMVRQLHFLGRGMQIKGQGPSLTSLKKVKKKLKKFIFFIDIR